MSKVETELTARRMALNHQLFVEEFGKAMVQRLDDQPDLVSDIPTMRGLAVSIRVCADDLNDSARHESRLRVRELTADLANLAMRFNQLYGT